jgi:hypothetical protein
MIKYASLIVSAVICAFSVVTLKGQTPSADPTSIDSIRLELGLSKTSENTDDAFSKSAMSNLVVSVKENALSAIRSSDESLCLAPLGKISIFCDLLAMEKTLPTEKCVAVAETLEKLALISEALVRKVGELRESNSLRLEQLQSTAPLHETVYGINLADAKSLVEGQLGRNNMGLSALHKKAHEIEQRVLGQLAMMRAVSKKE